MAFIVAYDTIGTGLNMSEFQNGVLFFSTKGESQTILLDDSPYDIDTNLVTFQVFEDNITYYIGMYYSPQPFGDVVIEDIFFFDQNINSLLDWVGANIYIAYEDLISGGDDWVFDGFNGDDEINGNSYNDILKGGPRNDTLRGQAGNDALFGELHNDSLIGGLGADRLSGGAGADLMLGGFGNDLYIVDNLGDRVRESAGAGIDAVQSSVSHVLAANVENLTLTGTARIGGIGNSAANVVLGNAAANTLSGGLGADRLLGGAGPDQLLGRFGNDRLIGRLGADRMAGGAGADLFVFVAGSDSGLGAVRDAIQDFATGIDRCDLRAVDADSLQVGNQAFDFIGARTFSDAGQLRFQRGILSGELNGDRIADFEIAFTGRAALAETDILL